MQHYVTFYPLLLPAAITLAGICYVGWMARLSREHFHDT